MKITINDYNYNLICSITSTSLSPSNLFRSIQLVTHRWTLAHIPQVSATCSRRRPTPTVWRGLATPLPPPAACRLYPPWWTLPTEDREVHPNKLAPVQPVHTWWSQAPSPAARQSPTTSHMYPPPPTPWHPWSDNPRRPLNKDPLQKVWPTF